jgi:hypothetical protein
MAGGNCYRTVFTQTDFPIAIAITSRQKKWHAVKIGPTFAIASFAFAGTVFSVRSVDPLDTIPLGTFD